MGRSRIPGRTAGLVASIAFGAIAGFGMLGGGLVHATDESAWTMGHHAVSVLQESTSDGADTGGTVFTPFESAWT